MRVRITRDPGILDPSKAFYNVARQRGDGSWFHIESFVDLKNAQAYVADMRHRYENPVKSELVEEHTIITGDENG